LDEYKPDILCLGYDQKTIDENKLKEELKKRNINAEIIRAKPFKENIYKSSILKK
jgi:glycerol-3-phosphate cytidylyltransferase-like family protein